MAPDLLATSAGEPSLPEPDRYWAAQDWEAWMCIALDQARQAGRHGEAPVGALLLGRAPDADELDRSPLILARAYNSPIRLHDPTAHAELLCLRQAARMLGNYRLPQTVLVCTLEPCLMCLGALVHARCAGLVYGAPDPKAGAARSRLDGPRLPFLNHRFWIVDGVLAAECGALLSQFFQTRRQAKKAEKELSFPGA
jgi:tRNA(adenine34) deaminase